MVKLRIRELAEERAYHLLSLTSGVSEEDIKTYAEQTVEDFKKIATVLNWSIAEPGVDRVFKMLDPGKAKDISLQLLSTASGISEKDIQKYANEDINIAEKASDLKKIASILDVEPVQLIAFEVKREAVKLKIAELAQSQGMTLTQLSEQSKVNLEILCFYSTQPIEKEKLGDPKIQANLIAISKALKCNIEDLKDPNLVELPPTRLRIQEFIDERNLTLEELSMITEINPELIELFVNHPVDMKTLNGWFIGIGEVAILCRLVCSLFGCKCE